MAGDGEYDLVDGMIAVTNMIVPDGVFLNLMEQDGLDFDDPWWAKDMDENLSVAGKLYGICGAGLLSMYKSSYIISMTSVLRTRLISFLTASGRSKR